MARLDGTAGFCVDNHVPIEEAVERLLEIAGDRMDLLNYTAGHALGGWEVDPVVRPHGMQKANLMLAAGADPEQMKPHRLEIVARLSTPSPHAAPS